MEKFIIGENIRRLRKEKNITQEKICQEANISQPYLSRVERDLFTPSIKLLYRISKVLNVTIDELIVVKDE